MINQHTLTLLSLCVPEKCWHAYKLHQNKAKNISILRPVWVSFLNYWSFLTINFSLWTLHIAPSCCAWSRRLFTVLESQKMFWSGLKNGRISYYVWSTEDIISMLEIQETFFLRLNDSHDTFFTIFLKRKTNTSFQSYSSLKYFYNDCIVCNIAFYYDGPYAKVDI